MLTDDQKRRLLELAREAVVAQVTHAPAPVPSVEGLPAAHGAFVTVKRGDELRGCLGTLQCGRELAADIVRCAAEAASVDPRFEPVGVEELAEIAVDISVLGPLVDIDPRDPGAIVVGRHGLVVEQGRRRGLLLPQVAAERNWNVEEFLRHTCLKAGLSGDAWRRGARVYRFEAEVFGGRLGAEDPAGAPAAGSASPSPRGSLEG